MVGSEWRKAGRTYDALKELMASGVAVNEETLKTQMFAAWEALPFDFREKIEKRIFNRQTASVREAVNQELDAKIALNEQRKKEYTEAEQRYYDLKTKVDKAQTALSEKEKLVKFGEATLAFYKTIGLADYMIAR